MTEFDFIKNIFVNHQNQSILGDDCAILNVNSDKKLCISADMLIEGQHFFSDVSPRNLGHKSLAVNLSDLAACGSKPKFFTLSLATPDTNFNWWKNFAEGLFELAEKFNCRLIGGDTTKGQNKIISITIFGETEKEILRSGAKVGDDIWVSGNLGESRLSLDYLLGKLEKNKISEEIFNQSKQKLELPEPRINLGQNLQNLATSCIDISDGFLGDLTHILDSSKVGAFIDIKKARKLFPFQNLPIKIIDNCVFSGGDDYELCFTVSKINRDKMEKLEFINKSENIKLSRIGFITEELGLKLSENINWNSFEHFK